MTKTDETVAVLEESVVRLERRNARLEVAFAELAKTVTAQLPLRGRGPGVNALQEIAREVAEIEDHTAAVKRRQRLEDELAELGSAA